MPYSVSLTTGNTLNPDPQVGNFWQPIDKKKDSGGISQSTTLFKRTIYKWVALWLPFHWPHGIKTRPEMDQLQGGTPPAEFASDLEKLRILFNRFCTSEVEFAPHATLGQMSRSERMRHAYLHMDHHLRQFGA